MEEDIKDDTTEPAPHSHNGYEHTHEYDETQHHDHYDAHDPAKHSDLHQHDDMRDALTKLKSDITESKSALVDSYKNADVLNNDMLLSKLEELEIETIQKCNDGVNGIIESLAEKIEATNTEMNGLITANSEAYMTGLDSLKQSLNAQIDDLDAKKIEQNIFIVNDAVIAVPA